MNQILLIADPKNNVVDSMEVVGWELDQNHNDHVD